MKRLLLLSLFFLLLGGFSSLTAQTTIRIVTNQGEEYQGEVLYETPDTISMKSTEGIEVTIPRNEIRVVDYSYRRKGKSGGFWSVGLALGFPSGLNLVVARNLDRTWGLRLSGGYLSGFKGIQLEGMWNIGMSKSFSHNLHLGVGSFHLETDLSSISWDYLTAGYDVNWSGFYASVGLSVGSGQHEDAIEIKDVPNPQALFQVGYVIEFR